MPKSKYDEIKEQMNQQMWEHSSDELRNTKMNRYARGESDGDDLPESVKKVVKRGSLFGKTVAVIAFLGIGYVLYLFGGALSAFLRSLF